MLSNYFSFISF